MTEIFTQPPAGGAAPGPSQPGGSTDKKLTILIGFSVVFLIAALGTLGWVVLAGGDDGKRVETAQRNEADSERDAATKSADEQSSNDEASGDDSEEAASEEADVTLPKTTVPPPDPVEVTPQVTNVSFERPAAPSIVCTGEPLAYSGAQSVSYTHLRAHETVLDIVCRLLLENKKKTQKKKTQSLHNITQTYTIN